jgi:hypothetical protein
MRVEFYYNKRKYTCGIFKNELVKELRIRNEQGEVLAFCRRFTAVQMLQSNQEQFLILLSPPLHLSGEEGNFS